ncbi:DUF89 family protein [Candidatus Bipolaricaulota bacterium]|nr:DUF89 family protein [Candidatus Bipolaricaulota bacterium]
MKVQLDCIPCYVNQAMEASHYANMNKEKRWKVVKQVCEELSQVDRPSPSAQISQRVHKIVRELSEVEDPYLKQKKKSNNKAQEYYQEFRKKVDQNPDSLNRAARLAAAGNAIDFGPRRDFDVESELKQGLSEGFKLNHWPQFIDQLKFAKEIIYFTDNSGEIIYDRLFIERLLDCSPVKKLNLVVKDGPFLNDVTLQDARSLQFDEMEKVKLRTVDNGDGGESPTLWSPEVESWIDEHDLAISKGQANYEGLSDYRKSNLFFLLVVKCPLVEQDIGVNVGEKVFLNAKKHE